MTTKKGKSRWLIWKPRPQAVRNAPRLLTQLAASMSTSIQLTYMSTCLMVKIKALHLLPRSRNKTKTQSLTSLTRLCKTTSYKRPSKKSSELVLPCLPTRLNWLNSHQRFHPSQRGKLHRLEILLRSRSLRRRKKSRLPCKDRATILRQSKVKYS